MPPQGGEMPPQGGYPGEQAPPDAFEEEELEPLDPKEARTRIGYGILLGVAGLLLCCLPIGLIGAIFPFQVIGDLDAIEDDEEREDVRRHAITAFFICLAATVFSMLGYSIALISGS